MTNTSQPASSRNHRAHRVVGCCLIAPVALTICLYVAYKAANITPQITVPGHDMPAVNARDYFHRAYQVSRAMKHLTPYDMVGPEDQTNTLVNFRNCAIDAEPALKILREGLNQAYLNPAVRTWKSASQPYYAEYRELARINAGTARYYALTGEPGRSMQISLDGLEMGVMIPRGGDWVPGLVGLACESLASSDIEPLLPRLSASELAGTSARLRKIATERVPYSEIVQEEGYVETATMLDLLRHPDRSPMSEAIADLEFGMGSETPIKDRLSNSMQALHEAFVNKGSRLKQTLDVYTALANVAKGPYTNRTPPGIPKYADVATTISTFNFGWAKFVSMDSVLTLLRVETALFRYRKEHGSFPPSLVQLCPTYFRFVPLDPCDPRPGASLRYSATKGGAEFLLYSIGPDMSDNGGVPARYIGDQPGDIVAGKLYKYKPISTSAPPKSR